MSFTYIDIGIVALLLIFFLFGIKKGFMDSILSLVGGLVSLVIAILLADQVVQLIGDTFGIRTAISNWATGFLTNLFNPEGVENHPLTSPIGEENIGNLVMMAIGKLGLPESISQSIGGALTTAITNSIQGTEIAQKSLVQIINPIMTQAIMLVIAVILTFIVIRIIVAIIEAITKAILRVSKSLRGLDRLLGGVVGIVKGALAVLIIFTIGFFVLSGTDPNSQGGDLKTQVRVTIEQSQIGKLVYDNNPIPAWITQNINIDKILGDILGGGNNQPQTTPDPTSEPSPSPEPTGDLE